MAVCEGGRGPGDPGDRVLLGGARFESPLKSVDFLAAYPALLGRRFAAASLQDCLDSAGKPPPPSARPCQEGLVSVCLLVSQRLPVPTLSRHGRSRGASGPSRPSPSCLGAPAPREPRLPPVGLSPGQGANAQAAVSNAQPPRPGARSHRPQIPEPLLWGPQCACPLGALVPGWPPVPAVPHASLALSL